MDTTEQYIEMCKKATEIQKIWRPNHGDVFYIESEVMGNEVYYIGDVPNYYKENEHDWSFSTHGCGCCSESLGHSNYTWLPRQDQLQDIHAYNYPKIDLYNLLYCFNAFLHGHSDQTRPHSPESLWLEFLMEKLYSKRWVNGEWEVVEEFKAETKSTQSDMNDILTVLDYLEKLYGDAPHKNVSPATRIKTLVKGIKGEH